MFRLFALLLALAPILGTAVPAPLDQASPAALGLQIANERVVRLPDAVPFSLSPDGRWLVGWQDLGRDGEICAYDAGSLSEHACATIAMRSLAMESAVWSPDGSRLAFTETIVDEGDIRVFTAETGSVANLTDDGIETLRPGDSLGSIDFAPAWSPDSRELAFVRVVAADEEVSTAIYRIPVDGGEPALVVSVAEHAWAVEDRLQWSADGKTIVYTAGLLSADEPLLGAYGVSPDGGEPREIGDDLALYLNRPVIVDLAAQDIALLFFRASFDDPARIPAYGVLDLATGVLATLPPTIGEPPSAVLWTAGFSPDGANLILIYSDQSVIVRDLVSGEEQPLGMISARVGDTIVWATNGLVFGRSQDNSGLLFHLEER